MSIFEQIPQILIAIEFRPRSFIYNACKQYDSGELIFVWLCTDSKGKEMLDRRRIRSWRAA